MNPDLRLARDVQPWMDRLATLLPSPPRISTREGYLGDGVIGARSGPEISFGAVAHELAHGFEMISSGRPQSFQQRSWGMRITTRLVIGGEEYEEPVTTQASEREARASGIQLRLLQAVGHPEARGFVQRQARVLCRWMPDWCLGGKGDEARLKHRAKLIRQAHAQWPLERIQAEWPQVRALLDQAYEANPPSDGPAVRKLRRPA